MRFAQALFDQHEFDLKWCQCLDCYMLPWGILYRHFCGWDRNSSIYLAMHILTIDIATQKSSMSDQIFMIKYVIISYLYIIHSQFCPYNRQKGGVCLLSNVLYSLFPLPFILFLYWISALFNPLMPLRNTNVITATRSLSSFFLIFPSMSRQFEMFHQNNHMANMMNISLCAFPFMN